MRSRILVRLLLVLKGVPLVGVGLPLAGFGLRVFILADTSLAENRVGGVKFRLMSMSLGVAKNLLRSLKFRMSRRAPGVALDPGTTGEA
jgi:hypothetical protein